MNGIYLLLGSNIGNRLEYLREAENLLIQHNIHIIDESSIYETEPWGNKNQGWFLNIVLEVKTSFSEKELLEEIQAIENHIGRIRKEKWGERCIDIDILYYNNQIIDTKELTLPHAGIISRRFTLVPLVEMCPLEMHPQEEKNQMELLADCSDVLACRLTDYKL